MDYKKVHAENKVQSIEGRYINLNTIVPIMESFKRKFKIVIAGHSVLKRPIYQCQIGTGLIKVLMWSQMHGNESTTTKGLLDFMNMLCANSKVSEEILKTYSFIIIPMLNPDGAEVYTRVNANEIDLNRDFQNLTQPESQLLMQIFNDFKPNYCFNLHDQRTIFGVGTTGKPATISFLAPSFDEEKGYDDARLKSVAAITKMFHVLNNIIPGQVARFDDAFNNNCVGDTFQSMGTPTVLIEAGHYSNDYQREETRKYVFIALLSTFQTVNENVVVTDHLSDYLKIPQNKSNFFDFIYKNVAINYEASNIITNFAVQFREELINNKIVFNGFIAKVGNLENYFGHLEIDAFQLSYSGDHDTIPKLEEKASFSIDNEVKFVNGLVKK
jgi:hypothetical protein